MVHTKSSKLTSLCNGSVSSEEKLATTVSGNGGYTDPMRRRKSKRLKVAAVSESSPDSGSISLRLRSRTKQKEVPIEACENRNVSDDCVLSSDVEVELIHGRNVGERDHLKLVDKKLCNGTDAGVTEGAESHRVNKHDPVKDKNLAEDTSELNVMVESAFRQSIIGTRILRGRTGTVVRDLPPNMG